MLAWYEEKEKYSSASSVSDNELSVGVVDVAKGDAIKDGAEIQMPTALCKPVIVGKIEGQVKKTGFQSNRYWFADEEVEPIVIKIRDAFLKTRSTRIDLPDENNFSIKLNAEASRGLEINRYKTLKELEYECYK